MGGGYEPVRVDRVRVQRTTPHLKGQSNLLRGKDIFRRLSIAEKRDHVPVFAVVGALGFDPIKSAALIDEFHSAGIESFSRREVAKLLVRFHPETTYSPDLAEKALLEFRAELRPEIFMDAHVGARPTFLTLDLAAPEQLVIERLKSEETPIDERLALEFIYNNPESFKSLVVSLREAGIAFHPQEIVNIVTRGLIENSHFSETNHSRTPSERMFEAYRIGRLYSVAVERNILSEMEFSHFVGNYHSNTEFRQLIIDGITSPEIAEQYFVGINTLELTDVVMQRSKSHETTTLSNESKAYNFEDVVYAGKIAVEIQEAVVAKDVERVKELYDARPEIAQKALERMGIDSVEMVVDLAERQIDDLDIFIDLPENEYLRSKELFHEKVEIHEQRYSIQWALTVVRAIAERSGEINHVARILINRVETSKSAAKILASMPEALPEIISEYRKTDLNCKKSKILSELIVTIATSFKIELPEQFAPMVIELAQDPRIVNDAQIRELILGIIEAHAGFIRNFAIFVETNKEAIRQFQEAMLAEKRRLSNEDQKVIPIQIAALVVGIKAAVVNLDYEKVQALAQELAVLISKTNAPISSDVRYLLGFAAAKPDFAVRDKSVSEVKEAFASGDRNALLTAIGKVQLIAEAEVDTGLNEAYARSQNLHLYTEAVVYSKIIRETALTSRAKDILNILMRDSKVWDGLSVLADTGRYDDVQTIIRSIINSARETDWRLSGNSISEAINSANTQRTIKTILNETGQALAA